MKPKSEPMVTLAVVGALAVNYLNTTHGEYLGHDHHCPIPYAPALTTPTPMDVERCTCGWATFYGAYLKVAAESEETRG